MSNAHNIRGLSYLNSCPFFVRVIVTLLKGSSINARIAETDVCLYFLWVSRSVLEQKFCIYKSRSRLIENNRPNARMQNVLLLKRSQYITGLKNSENRIIDLTSCFGVLGRTTCNSASCAFSLMQDTWWGEWLTPRPGRSTPLNRRLKYFISLRLFSHLHLGVTSGPGFTVSGTCPAGLSLLDLLKVQKIL